MLPAGHISSERWPSVVEIPAHGDQFHAIWAELIRLAAKPAAPWTLIGSQMVHLHGWMAGAERPALSKEADLLADSVTVLTATRKLSEQLVDSGFELADRSALGTSHLFKKGDVEIDVLAPEKISDANRQTYGGVRTVAVPGGRQAIHRTIRLQVKSRDIEGEVPVPNLLGAILIKCRAIGVSSRPDSQREDFAFLLSLVKGLQETDTFRAQLEGRQRTWLREREEIANVRHPCWLRIANAQQGVVTYRRLIAPS